MIPLVQQLRAVWKHERNRQEQWRKLLPVGVDPQDLLPEEIKALADFEREQEEEITKDNEDEIPYNIYTLAQKLGKRNAELVGEEEVYAYDDLHDTLMEYNNEAEKLITNLSASLLFSANEVATLYKKYCELFNSPDLEKFIVDHAYNIDKTPKEIYIKCLEVEKNALSYTVINNLSYLHLTIFD